MAVLQQLRLPGADQRQRVLYGSVLPRAAADGTQGPAVFKYQHLPLGTGGRPGDRRQGQDSIARPLGFGLLLGRKKFCLFHALAPFLWRFIKSPP